MPVLQLNPDEGLFYEWESPAADGGLTFVFVNAVTGDLGTCEAAVGAQLRAAGHGTLAYHCRGHGNSPGRPSADATDDLRRLLAALQPPRPVLVGSAPPTGIDCAGTVMLDSADAPERLLATLLGFAWEHGT